MFNRRFICYSTGLILVFIGTSSCKVISGKNQEREKLIFPNKNHWDRDVSIILERKNNLRVKEKYIYIKGGVSINFSVKIMDSKPEKDFKIENKCIIFALRDFMRDLEFINVKIHVTYIDKKYLYIVITAINNGQSVSYFFDEKAALLNIMKAY